MASTKRISAAVFGVLTLLMVTYAYCATAFADTKPDKTLLTKEQSDTIIQNCSNIKQSLSKLEHADSRTRTYLGTAYESINGHFITPLNLRLIKNDISTGELFRIQSDFAAEQVVFRDSYIDYMRELESLIATDCALHPQEFYDQLEIVREKRTILQASTKKLTALAEEQYQNVDKLRESL